MFDHPERNCIYDEALFSASMPKYRKQPLMGQVESYQAEGYPAGNGLMAAGLIVRDARRNDLSSINEMWWQENLLWTFQDQLSLPVVLWRLGHHCEPIQGNLWRNDVVEWAEHKRDPDTAQPCIGLSATLNADPVSVAHYYIDRLGSTFDPLNRQLIEVSRECEFLAVGWSFDQNARVPAGGVGIVVDGQPFAATYGLDRPDVAGHFKCPDCLKTGFFFVAPVDFFGPGTHKLAVRVISPDKTSYTEGQAIALQIGKI
jgi:hypothetical protein